jgi:hypothetical protein
MKISYFFRKPIFPIICHIDGNLVAAKSKSEFVRKISRFDLDNEGKYDIIDISGEGWTLDCRLKLISPLTFPRRRNKKWSKHEIIELYNSKQGVESEYSERSLSNKRFEKVFMDLVELISKRKRRKTNTKNRSSL